MTCFHMRLHVPYLPLNRAPNILPFPLNDYVVEHTHFQSSTMLSTCHVSSTSFSTGSSCKELHRIEALQKSVDVVEISTFGGVGIDSPEEAHGDGCSDYQDLYDKDYTEMQRRETAGQWTKGHISCNKGIIHSEETSKCIGERTREALRDPKVQKKMREPLSDERKAKISVLQRKVWAKRLNVKHQKQKLLQSWAQSIAETAKKGGRGEGKLGWDSYKKMLEEMDLLEIQRTEADKRSNVKHQKQKLLQSWAQSIAETAKKGGRGEGKLGWDSYKKMLEEMDLLEIQRAEADKMAQKMKERMKVLAQKKIEREEKAKIRVKKLRSWNEKKEESALAQGKKLRHKLRKIRKSKGISGRAHGQVSAVPHIPAPEKLDLEHIKKEKTRKEVSLADQLRAAKNKRSELAAQRSKK